MKLALVYRGALRSCNYACAYCPLPRRAPAREAGEDAAALARFVALVAGRRADELSILLAPRGEALLHARWREALLALAALPGVRRVVAQTNLSASPRWLRAAPAGKVQLWASFHPTQTSAEAFAGRCAALADLGVAFSVGAVAIPAHLAAVEQLRRLLPAQAYLWLNRRHGAAPLGSADRARVRAIDPWFVEAAPTSRGRPCAAGAAALFVDGDGTARRCLGVPARRGNVFDAPLEALVTSEPAPCPAPACRCHLGRIHLDDPRPNDPGAALARIPAAWPRPDEARG